MKTKYSLVLPSYNEYGNLKLLLPEIFKSFFKRNYQIIIVDDNSIDQTIKKLKKEFKRRKQIKYILRKKNRSLGLSIKKGIEASSGENIIVMDSDFNHRPQDLKKMILKYEKNKLDMLCGSRFLKGGSSNTFFRHLCSLFFNIFINILTKGNISDNLSGFFIVKKKYIRKDLKKIFYGYGEFYIRLLFFMQKKKIKISEFPVKYALRKYGNSKSRLVRMLFLYTKETIKLLK
ncbi:glycosyltransferase [Pelagibacteraceae bacterium]|jgi:dolichol-phosphate mannosyltransferase|nr:glycosyltransferase [Pelagibacteraceae bacterium]